MEMTLITMSAPIDATGDVAQMEAKWGEIEWARPSLIVGKTNRVFRQILAGLLKGV